MIIGVDGNDANVEHKVGVSVYTHNLLQYFSQHATKEVKFNVFLRVQPNDEMPKETEYYKYTVVKAPALWSQVFLPLHLMIRRPVDVFFSPAHYSPRLCPVSLVVTIHDLAYFYYPNEFLKKDLYKLKNWTANSLKKATTIIAVSKTTKKDIMKFYSVAENKIKVIYNGYEKQGMNKNNDEILKTLQVKPQNYILYVGTLQPRKNINVLIEAFALFHKQNSEYKLVLVGKKGWLYDEIFQKVQDLNLSNDVIFTGYLPDEDVNSLYKHAFCYVLPSLYEGFGIPVLEAMANGCPVISSFASSLPEVGGEAAIYFNPEDAKGLYDDLLDLQNSKTLRKEIIMKGKEQIKKFSWETCAKETLDVLMEAKT